MYVSIKGSVMWDFDKLSIKYSEHQLQKLRNHVPIPKVCPVCTTKFDAQSYIFRTTAIYPHERHTCSDTCKRIYGGRKNKRVIKEYVCKGCNNPFTPHPRKPHQMFCNKKCRGRLLRAQPRPEVQRWVHKLSPPKGSVSKWCTEWLNSYTVTHYEHPIPLNGKTYRVDAYDEHTNTVYEYLGSFWHGNPDIYPPTEIHPVCKKTYGELYEQTMNRIQTLRNAGYNVVYVWSKR